MAVTRKLLKALGIEDEKADQIIEAHSETVEALKKERDKYKTDAEALPGVQKELDDLKEAAEKNGDAPYKAQYEDLKKEFEDYKADVTAKETKAKKVAAYRKLLLDAKISEKRIDSILKLSPVDELELDDKGEPKDAEAVKKAITDEWADFIVKEETHGAGTHNPPAGSGGGGTNNGGATKSRAAQLAEQYHNSLYGANKEDN